MPPYGKADIADDLLLDSDKKDEDILPNKPSIHQLNTLVRDVISRSSWWDLYGIDLAIMCVTFALLPISYFLIGSGSIPLFVIGFLVFAHIHAAFTVKFAHAAVHNALAGSSPFWNRLLTLFFVELWGGFSSEGTHEAHIQLHHPYTNVIGLGDSSSWRVLPFLDRITYLFIAPLFLPLFNADWCHSASWTVVVNSQAPLCRISWLLYALLYVSLRCWFLLLWFHFVHGFYSFCACHSIYPC